jgi:hypothetical protein
MKLRKKSIILLIAGVLVFAIGCQAEKEKDFYGIGEEEVSTLLTGLILNQGLVDLRDGTVLDQQAGIIWKKCSAGQAYRSDANDCRGTQSPSLYTSFDGLRWGAVQLAHCSNNTYACNSLTFPYVLTENSGFAVPGFSEAYNHCKSLNDANGFPGWRVPSPLELTKLTIGGRIALLQLFPDTQEGLYWSSWSHAEDLEGTKADAIDFDREEFGSQKIRSKTEKYFVRCVRNTTPAQ